MRRWRIAAGLAVVALALGVGGAAWLWHRPAEPAGSAPATRVAPVATAAAPVGSTASSAPGAASVVAPGGLLSAKMAEFLASLPAEGLEICGVGRFQASDLLQLLAHPTEARAWFEAQEQQSERRAKQALARIAARLAAGGDLQQVAARLLMQDAEGAAALAERSQDAAAYGLALRACSMPAFGPASGCAQLSAQRWAALDPQDARPWLRLLSEAYRRKDVAAADAALAELAARPRYSRTTGLLEAQLAPALEVVPDANDRLHARVGVMGHDAMLSLTDSFGLFRTCKQAHDPQRQAHCRRAARQMLASTDALFEAQQAQRLAETLGVPRAELAHDAATLDAASEQLQAQAADLGLDCASQRRMESFSAERAVQGEVAFALALVSARGMPSNAPAAAAPR